MTERNSPRQMTARWNREYEAIKEEHRRGPEGSRDRWHALVDENQRREQELREEYGR